MLEEADLNYLKASLTLTTRKLEVLSFEEKNTVRSKVIDFTNLRNNLSNQQDYFYTHRWLDSRGGGGTLYGQTLPKGS